MLTQLAGDNMKKINTKSITLSSILCAISLTMFVIEAQIPLPIAVPGIKLGIANTVTLFALFYLPFREALLILLGRIILGSIFASNPSIILYSLSGGLLSILGECLILKLTSKKFVVEISIIGAMLHNTGQILCAAFITGTAYVFTYLPVLLIAGIITGTFCGLCVLGVDKVIGSAIIKLLKN